MVQPCTPTGIITSKDYLKLATHRTNAFAVTKNLTTTATEQCYVKKMKYSYCRKVTVKKGKRTVLYPQPANENSRHNELYEEHKKK